MKKQIETISTPAEIAAAPTRVLLATYNKIRGTQIQKFENRAKAEALTRAALDSVPPPRVPYTKGKAKPAPATPLSEIVPPRVQAIPPTPQQRPRPAPQIDPKGPTSQTPAAQPVAPEFGSEMVRPESADASFWRHPSDRSHRSVMAMPEFIAGVMGNPYPPGSLSSRLWNEADKSPVPPLRLTLADMPKRVRQATYDSVRASDGGVTKLHAASERAEYLAVIRRHSPEGLTVKKLMAMLEKDETKVRGTLQKLIAAGHVIAFNAPTKGKK